MNWGCYYVQGKQGWETLQGAIVNNKVNKDWPYWILECNFAKKKLKLFFIIWSENNMNTSLRAANILRVSSFYRTTKLLVATK